VGVGKNSTQVTKCLVKPIITSVKIVRQVMIYESPLENGGVFVTHNASG